MPICVNMSFHISIFLQYICKHIFYHSDCPNCNIQCCSNLLSLACLFWKGDSSSVALSELFFFFLVWEFFLVRFKGQRALCAVQIVKSLETEFVAV